ncbi:MAG: protein kinase [Planctomycetes bacterium]|nr:protein kinase [Planctomycetota bacterium]
MKEHPESMEQAFELYLEERRLGGSGDPSQFAARFPELGPDLASAIRALAALEAVTREPGRGAVPDRVGPFRVLREIGRGGMGVVLEAIEEQLGRRVALKVIPPEFLASTSARERFRREAALASRLDHPGIATIYGTGVEEDRPWIAMRYVEGLTLAQSIHAAREAHAACVQLPLTRGDARQQFLALGGCVARVARALQSAHEQGVVHRDVKPSNIVVARDGAPVLLDFGLAIADELEGQSLTRTGETAGTPAYLAPELVGGERSRPDAQSDVYSLGVTLYECLALRRPFEAPTPIALYHAITSSATPMLRSVPHDLAVVVATAMERDRTRRYRSAAAFAADLEACVAGRPIAARPLPPHGRLLRWARREPRQALLSSLLALATLAAAALGGNWWASRDEVLAAAEGVRHSELEDAIAEGFHLYGQKHLDRAERAFERVQQLDPRSQEAVVGQILCGLSRRSATELQQLLARLPSGMRSRDPLEALIEHREMPAEATSGDLAGASALDLCVLGLCLQADAMRLPFYDRGEPNRLSLRCFTEAILRAPVARPLYFEQRAFMAERMRDVAAERSAANALLALWPDSPRALYAAGHALTVDDPRAAVPLLERSLTLAPDEIDTYNMLAIAYCAIGQPESGESCAWRALAIDPGSARMNYWLGYALTLQDCAEEARLALVRGLSLDPKLSQAWSQVALIDLLRGDASGACPLYARALELEPSDDHARMFYSAALELAGQTELAHDSFNRAVAGKFPDTAASWKALAGVFAYIRAPQTSLQAAETGLALAPNDVELAQLRDAAQEQLEASR